MKQKITLLTSLVIVALLAATAISVAGDTRPTSSSPQIEPRKALADVGQLKVFSQPSAFDSEEASSFSRLKSELKNYPPEITAGQVDLASAHPFSVPSGDGIVWVAKSADGGICVFTPQLAADAPSGFASACSSLADFNKTGLATLTAGEEDDFVSVSVQPSDVAAPVVLESDGDSERLPVESNVSVATVDAGDAVSSGGLTLSTYDVAQQ